MTKDPQMTQIHADDSRERVEHVNRCGLHCYQKTHDFL